MYTICGIACCWLRPWEHRTLKNLFTIGCLMNTSGAVWSHNLIQWTPWGRMTHLWFNEVSLFQLLVCIKHTLCWNLNWKIYQEYFISRKLFPNIFKMATIVSWAQSVNSLWPSEAILWSLVKYICVNISSGNGLLPDGTKPLTESMFTTHQRSNE